MTKIIAFLSIPFLLSACGNNKPSRINKDSIKSVLSKPKEDIIYDTTSDKDDIEALHGGKFTVADINFRYAIVDDECIIEKQEGNNWSKVLSYDYSHRTDSLLVDVNNDGFTDIVNSWRWNDDVYLFNPDKKSYDTTDMVQLENQRVLLDSTNNIYCSLLQGKGQAEMSFLYTFDKLTQKLLFSIEFQNKIIDKEDALESVVGYKLYEGVNSEEKKGRLIRVEKCKPTMDFDYVSFWKKNYKELLQLK